MPNQKPVMVSPHAQRQLQCRGATEDEVIQTINEAPWNAAELDRLECRKDFVFGKSWNKKYYNVKQIRPIFIEEANRVVVVTVYVYYF